MRIPGCILSRLNWTKVGLKGPWHRTGKIPASGLNWTKVGLKGPIRKPLTFCIYSLNWTKVGLKVFWTVP